MEYPVLAGLDAGTYTAVEDIDADLTGQELLADYAVFVASAVKRHSRCAPCLREGAERGLRSPKPP
ncbi:MAG: hypothetical protein LUD80_03355 [Clostridiales bacterium]|nr:hypothetical protein [Clostridiales bacterium]